MSKTKGAQTPREDERNRDVLIWLNGRLVRRAEAVVSILTRGSGSGTASGRAFGSAMAVSSPSKTIFAASMRARAPSPSISA
jgi:hypothetical protein